MTLNEYIRTILELYPTLDEWNQPEFARVFQFIDRGEIIRWYCFPTTPIVHWYITPEDAGEIACCESAEARLWLALHGPLVSDTPEGYEVTWRPSYDGHNITLLPTSPSAAHYRNMSNRKHIL